MGRFALAMNSMNIKRRWAFGPKGERELEVAAQSRALQGGPKAMRAKRTVWKLILAIDFALLLLPIVLPPAPVWPSWLRVAPYLLMIVVFPFFQWDGAVLYALSGVLLIGESLCFDSLQTNFLMPWDSSGLICDWAPWFQMAAIGVAVVVEALGGRMRKIAT